MQRDGRGARRRRASGGRRVRRMVAGVGAELRRWGIAPADEGVPSLRHRLTVFPLVFIPWLILYEFVVYRGPFSGSFETYLPGEINWPIWQWAEILYVSPYVLVTLVPFVATTNQVLRRFVIAGLLATAAIDILFLTVPALATPRPFTPHGFLGAMMEWDRRMDLNNGTASCPSFHVVWAFLGGAVFGQRFPRWQWAWWIWSAAVSLSCVFTGMHSLIDIVAGFGVFLAAYHYATRFRGTVHEVVPTEGLVVDRQRIFEDGGL